MEALGRRERRPRSSNSQPALTLWIPKATQELLATEDRIGLFRSAA
jgi:hypothetical protein